MNGWTPTIPEEERVRNELASCKAFLQRDPNNQYWINRLADLEQKRILFNITPEAHEEYMGNLVHAAYMEAAESVDEPEGTEPSPYISGGEVYYRYMGKSNLADDEIPF